MVDFNITLPIQIVNFVIALVVINLLIIRPVRGIIRKRQDLTNDLTRESGKFAEESALRLKKYETELDAVRLQAAGQRETAKTQAVEAGRAILDNAQNEASLFLQRSHKEAEQEAEAARRVLHGQASALAEKMVSRIMG